MISPGYLIFFWQQPYLGGRGRGRGALGLLAQPRVGIASTAAAPSAAAVPAAAAADVTDPKKLIRKVEKKLRQVSCVIYYNMGNFLMPR